MIDEIRVPDVLKKCTEDVETAKQLSTRATSRALIERIQTINKDHPTYFAQIGCTETPGEVQIVVEVLLPWPQRRHQQEGDAEESKQAVDGQAAALMKYMD